MGSLVPITPSSSGLTPRQAARARRVQMRADMEVFSHGLMADAEAECDRQDAQATADAIRASLEEELNLLEYGMARARGSTAKTELVATKVEMLASINNRRLQRHFG